jgi:hypothetical protein
MWTCDADTKRALRLLLAWIAPLALSACPPSEPREGEGETAEGEGEAAEGEGEEGEGEGEGEGDGRCVRTDALDDGRACFVDDDCACGAHCAAGSCAADCRVDDDCDGDDVCDDFGRCAALGAPRVRFVRPAPGVSADRTVLRATAPDAPVSFFLRGAPDGSTSRVSLRTVGGALVRCGDVDADACTIDVGPAGQPIFVIAPSTAFDAPGTAPIGVDAFANGQTTSLRVAIAAASTAAPPTGTLIEQRRARYSGFARINDGAGLVGAVPGVTGADIAVEAALQGSGTSGVLTLTDPSGLALPIDEVNLAVTEDAGVLRVRMPRLLWLKRGGSEVVSDAVDVDVAAGDNALRLTLPLQLLGLALPGQEAPVVTLHIDLTRAGDVDGGAVPAVTDDADIAYDLNRGTGRLGDGARIEAIALGLATLNTNLDSDDRSVVGCVDSDNALLRRAPRFEDACDEAYSDRLGGVQGLGTSIKSLHPPATCAAAVQADGSAVVPCHFVGRFDDTLTIVDFDDNACPAIASDVGCTIQPANIPFNQGTGFAHVATEVCVLEAFVPPDEAACARAMLCSDSEVALDDSHQLRAVSEASGDLVCNEDVGSEIAPALERTPDALVTFIDDCVDDLVEAGSADAPVTNAALFETRECLSAHRLFLALDQALSAARAGVDAPVSARVAQRQLQQLFAVQNLVAQGTVDLFREDLALGRATSTSTALTRIDATLAPLAVVLDPRVSGALLALPAATLADPDPRPDYGFVLDATTPNAPTEGLPVSMLEAAGQSLAALDFLTDRTWREANADGIRDLRARFADALRSFHVVAVLAETLHARALTAEPALSWQAAYDNARSQYLLAVRRHLDRVRDIDAGKNPLGLEPTDVPIYFPGEPDNDRDRFLAVSRFLTGTGPGSLTGLAPRAIADADAALESARAAFRDRTDVDINAEERIDDITRRYGELITGFCGAPIDDPDFDVDSFNVLDRELDTEVCFLEPSCRARPDAFLETVTSADLGFELCVAKRARAEFGAAVTVDPRIETALALFNENRFNVGLDALAHPTANDRRAEVRIAGQSLVLPLDENGRLFVSMSPGLFEQAKAGLGEVGPIERIRATCEDGRGTLNATRVTRPGACETADTCAVGQRCIEGACAAPPRDPLDSVECYFDGAISEQALAVRQAANEVAIAQAELDEFASRYDIALRSCLILKAGNEQRAQLETDHAKTMNDMDIGRAAAASAAEALQATSDCTATASGTSNAISSGVAAISCGFGFGAAAARIAAEAVQTSMNVAERNHALVVAAVEDQTELRICVNDAGLELVGAKAATLRIVSAQQTQAQAILNLRGQKSYTAALHAEGRIAVENERRRLARALPSRSILSDAAERYLDRFEYAQRLTFLAVRAAEYELQRELPQLLRDVTAATRPVQLEDALRDVAAIVNSGQIDGSSPTGLIAVVSLRDHLLQLSGEESNPAGEQTLSAAERLRVLLTNPAFAVFDDDGDYLGQQIPFELQPLQTLGFGNNAGIGLFAQNDCAERIFAVNAAVVGDNVLTNGSTFTRMDLLQKNTFMSQQCRGSADAPFQVTTMQPAVNLLADQQDLSQRNLPSTATASLTRGQMQPYVNVDRADFEREEFQQGATTQLAGRGLYGEYALFLPAGALSVDGGPGLVLENVDDILLRIDYVAVAR